MAEEIGQKTPEKNSSGQHGIVPTGNSHLSFYVTHITYHVHKTLKITQVVISTSSRAQNLKHSLLSSLATARTCVLEPAVSSTLNNY